MIPDVIRIRRLKEWEEVVGIPEKVDGNVIVFKDLGEVMVDDNKIILKVKKNIGKRIAILRTDIEGKPYLLRVV